MKKAHKIVFVIFISIAALISFYLYNFKVKSMVMRCEIGKDWFEIELSRPIFGDITISEMHSAWDHKKNWCPDGALTLDGEYAVCTVRSTYIIRKLTSEHQKSKDKFVLIPLEAGKNIEVAPVKPNYSVEIINGPACPADSRCTVFEELEISSYTYFYTPGIYATPTKIAQILDEKYLRWPLEITETYVKKLDFNRKRWLWAELMVDVKISNTETIGVAYPYVGSTKGTFKMCS